MIKPEVSDKETLVVISSDPPYPSNLYLTNNVENDVIIIAWKLFNKFFKEPQ